METLEQIIERWNSDEGKPYKGSLIDWIAYDGDGDEPPADIGCMCAQGQVLHLLGGWEPKRLRITKQSIADRETANLLDISTAHAILLRNINDSVDGAPSIVLTNPEKILGDQAHIVLAFWRYLDRMTVVEWNAVAASSSGTLVAWVHRASVLRSTKPPFSPSRAPVDAACYGVPDTHHLVSASAASTIRAATVHACSEILCAPYLRARNYSFFFLPMFGFANPEAVLAADKRYPR